MDEIGLDFTKRWSKIIGSKEAVKKARKLRTSLVMQTDPTHVPFHVSVALTSRADGTFCPVQLLIHQGMVRVSTTCVCSSLVTVDITQRACGRGARQGVGVGRGAGGSAEGDEGRGRRRGAALTTSPPPPALSRTAARATLRGSAGDRRGRLRARRRVPWSSTCSMRTATTS